jgi:hypothetical protein
MPEGTATLATQAGIAAVAACKYDQNFVIAGGTATGGTDGIILRGVD